MVGKEKKQNDESVIPSENLLSSQNELSLSDRYRSFVIFGFGRVIFSRIMSLIYILLISRFVSRIVQDQMILLATGQGIIGIIAIFGLSYSLTKQAITEDNRDNIVSSAATIFFLLGLPVTLLLNIVLTIFASISFLEACIYLISCFLFFIQQLVIIIEDTRLRSDRAATFRTIYSILNSLFVPAFFLIFDSLSSVLLAWNVALIIPLIWERKIILNLFRSMKWDPQISWELLRFGFPIYLSSVFAAMAQRVDNFILFELFPVGELSQYYWVRRIADIVQEMFLILFTGAFPLLTKLKKQKHNELFETYIRSIFRMGLIISIIIYAFVFIEAHMLVSAILSAEFLGGVLILKTLTLAYFLLALTWLFQAVYAAEGKRRYLLEISLSSNLIRIGLLLIFANLGGIGIAWVVVFYSVYLITYYMYRSKQTIFAVLFRFRLAISMIFIGIQVFILPTPISLLESILIGTFFLLTSITILLIFRPLTITDISLIKRILGSRMKFITQTLRYISHNDSDNIKIYNVKNYLDSN